MYKFQTTTSENNQNFIAWYWNYKLLASKDG